MINASEFRIGNAVLHKENGRIRTVPFNPAIAALLDAGKTADLFPVVLNATLLEQYGFKENKKYALLPAAREFMLVLAIPGGAQNELRAYIKNNGECFVRAFTSGQPASRNLFHLHSLQNLFHALTGEELVPGK